MCLSTVYKVHDGTAEIFARNIQNVTNDNAAGEIQFTDIMGIRYSVKGKILNIDLIGNKIEIEES